MLERVAVRAARLANQLPAATRSGTGLAATIHRRAVSSSEIERFAKAICGENEDPSLLEKALIIAENELVLRAIAAQKVAVVERVRERSAIALARGDNSLALAKARFLKTQQAYDELAALRDKLLEKYKDKLPPPVLFEKMEEVLPEIELLFPLHLRIFLEDMDSELASKAQGQSWANINRTAEGAGERGESAALEEAALDLIRLDRYERRAWSRQKRAACAFTNIKLMQRSNVAASGISDHLQQVIVKQENI